ncbi:hypothetical protein HK097_011110 [Rhizophlyctis rosea]|uniref:Uncharacterized protein n=1 Tax=Rhizophlyctis rosea TaxID=64517 RepID=A0AAD5SH23_9FUNG|nr:hypothetical protein HK097_011110 [Rhizophlyctis rosea]
MAIKPPPPSRTSDLERKIRRGTQFFLNKNWEDARAVCEDLLAAEFPLRSSPSPDDARLHSALLRLYLRVAEQEGEEVEQLKRGKDGGNGRTQLPLEWSYAVEWYGGEVAVVADVLVCGLLLLTKRYHHSLARTTVEIWLASQPDEWFLLARDKSANPQTAANYERIVELYVLHILPDLEDWESAKQFLEYNDTLEEKRKKLYQDCLVRLETNKSSPPPDINPPQQPASTSPTHTPTSRPPPQSLSPASSTAESISTNPFTSTTSAAPAPEPVPVTSTSPAKRQSPQSLQLLARIRALFPALPPILVFLICVILSRRSAKMRAVMGIVARKVIATVRMAIDVHSL